MIGYIKAALAMQAAGDFKDFSLLKSCEPQGLRLAAWGSRGLRSENQRSVEIRRRLCAHVLDAARPVCAQVIETQAVAFRLDQIHELLLQACPLCRLDLDLEDR